MLEIADAMRLKICVRTAIEWWTGSRFVCGRSPQTKTHEMTFEGPNGWFRVIIEPIDPRER